MVNWNFLQKKRMERLREPLISNSMASGTPVIMMVNLQMGLQMETPLP